MNLCIDMGNTLSKIAVFDDGNKLLVLHRISSPLSAAILQPYFDKHPIKQSILGSVAQENTSAENFLQQQGAFLKFNHQTPILISNAYKTPHTLGLDRIAAVVGGQALFPNSNLLVIDAGTCITYDFLDEKKVYHGGAISPGIRIKFKALHTFTAKLPLVTITNIDNFIGNTTQTAIQSGVIFGTIAEIDGTIERYRAYCPNLKVLLTGGDSYFFDTKLKNRIFVLPNLVLQGLNQILNYNGLT